MASTQIDADFYTHIPVKNFSVERIRRGLSINPTLYQTISGELKSEMLRLDILGSPLNTEHAKSLLQQAFSAVELKYPIVFTPLPLPWKQRCLTAIAQKCNENKKKQHDRLQNRRHVSSFNSPSQTAYVRQPLRSMGIYIERRTKERCDKYICPVFELTRLSKNRFDEITVDDLDFAKFKKKLVESPDFHFNELQENLIYINTSGMDIPVTDEVVWKIGVEEMYWQMPNIVLRVIPRVQTESKVAFQGLGQKNIY